MTIIFLFSKIKHILHIYFQKGMTFKEKRELVKETSKRLDAIFYSSKMWKATNQKVAKKKKKQEEDGSGKVLPNPSDLDNYFLINVNFPVAFISKMRALNELDNLLLFNVYPRFFQGGLLFKTEQDAKRSLNLLEYKNWTILSPIKEVRANKAYVDEISSYYKEMGMFYDEENARLVGLRA